MKKETVFYTTMEIAEFLGVSASSIQRWADSGKLKCTSTEGGHRKFSVDHLKEFAMTYNISMKFLMEPTKRESASEKMFQPISAAQ